MNALEWEVFGHTADLIRGEIERNRLARNARDAASQRNLSKGEVSVERTNLTTDRPCCGPTARAMARVRDLWIAAEVDR